MPEPAVEEAYGTGRVLWVNGPFGIGKSTVAERLARETGAPVFDPEQVGFLLREVVPQRHLTGDFQDLVLWRTTTVHVAVGLAGLASPFLVMPMTVYRKDYLDELTDALTAAGVDLVSVALLAREQALAQRIRDRDLDDASKDWCRRHAATSLDALRSRTDMVQVDTTATVPGAVLDRIRHVLVERGWL